MIKFIIMIWIGAIGGCLIGGAITQNYGVIHTGVKIFVIGTTLLIIIGTLLIVGGWD